MCSIILNKINKDLTNIVRGFLLPINFENKYSSIISIKNVKNNDFLQQCYYIQLKRAFPQKKYEIFKRDVLYRYMTFKVDKINMNDYIFTENKHIYNYICYISCIYFFVNSSFKL